MTSREIKEKIADIIRRVSYKPGWEIKLDELYMMPTLYVTFKAPNLSSLQREITEVGTTYTFSPSYFREDIDQATLERRVLDDVHRLVRMLEIHEMDEWLKFDGTCLNDPHPELHMTTSLGLNHYSLDYNTAQSQQPLGGAELTTSGMSGELPAYIPLANYSLSDVYGLTLQSIPPDKQALDAILAEANKSEEPVLQSPE